MSEEPKLASEREELVFECTVPDAPEKVWRALTVPELLGAWLLPNDLKPQRGNRFSFDEMPGEGGKIDCEVLDAEPQRLIRYSWRDQAARQNGLDSVVGFELTRTANGGTHLRISHEASVITPTARPKTVAAANSNRPASLMPAA